MYTKFETAISTIISDKKQLKRIEKTHILYDTEILVTYNNKIKENVVFKLSESIPIELSIIIIHIIITDHRYNRLTRKSLEKKYNNRLDLIKSIYLESKDKDNKFVYKSKAQMIREYGEKTILPSLVNHRILISNNKYSFGIENIYSNYCKAYKLSKKYDLSGFDKQ